MMLITSLLFYHELQQVGAQQKFDELTSRAAFIFEGTVVSRNTSQTQVRIDTVLKGTSFAKTLKGVEALIEAADRKTAYERGTKAVFFIDGGDYGTSITLHAIGSVLLSETLPLKTKTTDLVQISEIKGRATRAEQVVLGRVVRVNEVEEDHKEKGESEHDPEWCVATIEVAETLKGTKMQTVKALFASSNDVMWANSPKLKVGSTAYFLIQKYSSPFLRKGGLAIVDQRDVVPSSSKALLTKAVNKL